MHSPGPPIDYPVDIPSAIVDAVTQSSRISWCPVLGLRVALYKFGDYDYGVIPD